MLAKLLWKFYWNLSGWKVNGKWPADVMKAVIIVGPHTSSWDVVTGMAARSVIPIPHAHYLGKKELFKGFFGWFFHATGGVPVDRDSKSKLVDQVVEEFNKREKFILALSPEGTRKRVDRLKTGFWHIAKQANVPIVMAGLDFSKKELILSEPFFTCDDQEADMKKILHFFSPIRGRYPELGMGHLG